MITLFKDKIKTEMGWSEDEYYTFYDRYLLYIAKYRSDSPSVLYTEDYMTAVLSLFFYVYKHRIANSQAFLLALILNGLPFDKYNLHPNSIQSEFIDSFFNDESFSFIDVDTLDVCKFLCEANFQNELPTYTDLYFDYLLFNDFRIVFKAVLLEDSQGLVIYHFNPAKIVYKVAPEQIFKAEEYILSLEKNLDKISNLNMKDLFKEKIESFKIFFDKKKSNE